MKRVKKPKRKLENLDATYPKGDSIYSSFMNSKKAGTQNAAADVMKKLDIEDDGKISTLDDEDAGKIEKEKIYAAMLSQYNDNRRKKFV